jgi:exodeoxyribonuclease-3
VGEWDVAFAAYVRKLQEAKPVVLIGDLNCSPTEIDLSRPKANLRHAGFTQVVVPHFF